jgi:hypothetical protein
VLKSAFFRLGDQLSRWDTMKKISYVFDLILGSRMAKN